MGKQFVISVMSKDRPGIIADVTSVIYNLGGDLADLDQSVMGGFFSMILMADFPESVEKQQLLKSFSGINSETTIEASIKEITHDLSLVRRDLPRETFVVTAQAKNRKGLVKTLGVFFYAHNINVLDLETTVSGEVYTMIFQVDLSHIEDMSKLRFELDNLGQMEGLELVMQHNDIYMATSEVGTALDTLLER